MTAYTVSTWVPPKDPATIIGLLDDAGFPRPDAEAWADGSTWLAGPSIVAAEAIAYDDHGIPLDQAITWHEHGFYAADATCFYDHDYTPEEAATVAHLVDQDADTDERLATGLAADRVIAYLRAGVTLDVYTDFENSDDSTDDALTMLAGFFQAP